MRKFFSLERQGKLKKGTAEKWAHETPNIKSLPMRLKKKSTVKKKMSKYATGGSVGQDSGKKVVVGFAKKAYDNVEPTTAKYMYDNKGNKYPTDSAVDKEGKEVPLYSPASKPSPRFSSNTVTGALKKKYATISTPQKKKDGGVVKGEGTEESDSNEAEIKVGSFVIPAKIREKLKMLLNSKGKANLKQKDGYSVELSKGEEVVDPNDAEEINDGMKSGGIKRGIDIFAPKSKKKFNKKYFTKK